MDNIQDIVAYCARVSNPDNQNNSETSEKLLKYLIKHKHWSPFEMVSVCLEITTTRDIARQILRHRSFSFQEFSQRYADPVKSLQAVRREARLQDFKNRQNSIEIDDTKLDQSWKGQQDLVWLQAVKAYNWAIEMGIAKEQARAVYQNSHAIDFMSWNFDLDHYIELRGKRNKKEHVEIASLQTQLLNLSYG